MNKDEFNRMCNLIYNNPGAYILLIGSGLSRLSKIYNAYEIQTELTKRILKIDNKLKDLDLDLIEVEKIYYENYNEKPTYETLLNRLCITEEERSCCIREFIEPTDAEYRSGEKIPIESHYAIAELVRREYIKIIITTNFDRLIETALHNSGINPNLVYKEEDINQLPPYFLIKNCLIIKPNGDYLATKTKNLSAELESYPQGMKKLLSDIASNHGILAFGWSVNYDSALKEILCNKKSEHYSNFITIYNNNITPEADELIYQRHMKKIEISIEDEDFFKTMLNTILSIEQLSSIEKSIDYETFKRNIILIEKKIDNINTITRKADKIVELINNLVNLGNEQKSVFKEKIVDKHSIELCSLIALLVNYDDNIIYLQLIKEVLERLCLYPSLIPDVTTINFPSIINLPCLLVFFTILSVSLKRHKFRYIEACLSDSRKATKVGPQIEYAYSCLFVNMNIMLSGDLHVFKSMIQSYNEELIMNYMEIINKNTNIFKDHYDIQHYFIQAESLLHLFESSRNIEFSWFSNSFIENYFKGNMDQFYTILFHSLQRNPSDLEFLCIDKHQLKKLVVTLIEKLSSIFEVKGMNKERLEALKDYITSF